MSSRTFTALLTCVLAAGATTLVGATAAGAALAGPRTLPAGAAGPGAAGPDAAGTLGAHDVDLLARAHARGERAVTLIIATDAGEVSDVAGDVRRLGGTVARRFDRVGYLLARVPTAKVLRTASLPGVAAIDLDEKIARPTPTVDARPGERAARQASPPAPGADTPADNAYLPTNEIGSVDFKAAHPGWDGRGVTIGIMDSGVDLDHPALQRTTTGQRKIVDWVTATDPLLEGDGTWRAMVTAVTGPSFGYGGDTWKAPAGTWRINRFFESITADSDPAGDVNRDGDTDDAFGVLYDPATNDVRVDADQDHDFTEEPVMRPYRDRFDVGHFGADDPTTPVAERTPFVVEFRTDVDLAPVGLAGRVADFVNIGVAESSHGTHVAGIAAANDLFGNVAFDGQAPGARIVSARACSWGGACTAAALTTGMVDLVVNRGVDVVNMSIGGLPSVNDANNARARLYDRLINDFGVQMFISAGNYGPGVNTVGDPSVASDVVSVAASISRRTWLANYGSVVRRPNALFNFSSRGPREDGGFKPNLVAPGAAVSTVNTWLAGEPVPEAGYPLPSGYAMFNGTSMAAPHATGGAALLLSAARATDRAVTPAALRRALYTSARAVVGTPAHVQGNGMMNVGGAWSLLAKGFETRRYTSSARVCTPLSGYLADPNAGTGIYNRCAVGDGGQRAGRSEIYPVRLRRTSGPDRAILHRLSWRGAGGAFRSQGSVRLPLHTAVDVDVVVTPVAGVNSAILRVDDPGTPTVDFEVLNTVVVAAAPSRPSYAFAAEGAVDRNSSTSYFVAVPERAEALQVDLSGIATGSHTRFITVDPRGVPVESTSSLACYTNRPQVDCVPGQRVYADPLPGVWEIEVESRRTSPSLRNPFQLTARVLGVTVSPQVLTLPEVVAERPAPVAWAVRNDFGPVVVAGRGGPLGSSIDKRPAIADNENRTFKVAVPEGATRLDVSIGNTGDTAADLDLAVHLAGKEVARSADGDSEEAVSIRLPEPGVYTVVVSGYSVPAGSTSFDYRDVFYSASLGRVGVPHRWVTVAGGDRGTITGTVVAAADPPADRRVFGELTVVTDSGAVVGGGVVAIDAVSTGPVRTQPVPLDRVP